MQGSKKQPEGQGLRPVSFGKLFRFAKKREKALLVLGGLFILLAGFSLIANLLLTLYLLKDVSEVYYLQKSYTEALDGLKESTMYVFIVGLLMAILMYAGLSIYMFVSDRIAYRLREAYLRSVLHMDMSWFDTLGAGEVTTRLSNDIDRIRDGIGEKVALLIMDTGIMLAIIVISFCLSAKLAIYVCSLLIFCLVALLIGNIYGQKLTTRALNEYAAAGSLAEEVLANITTVHSFNMTNKLVRIYESYIKSSEKFSNWRIFIDCISIGLLTFSVYFGVAIDFKVGVSMMGEGQTVMAAAAFNFISLFFAMYSVSSIPPNLLAITSARAAAAKIYQVIELVPTIHNVEEGKRELDEVKGTVSFKNINFSFPSRPDVPIFQNFTLEVTSGTTVALVGASGSGKSTLVQLLERFYDPIQGQISVDEVNIKDFNIKWFRCQLGLVSQEPVLFSGTIFENIAIGLIGTPYENVSVEEQWHLVEEASRNANAHDFITQLPNAYQTNVGEQGFLLSGGQKQRIAIARAIVKNPKILLLDEATSALDTKSEAIVQKALDKASQGRTTLVIAHRLSTVINADLIVVMDRGLIVEKGTHSELMILGGAYYNLVSLQNSRPTDSSLASGEANYTSTDSYEEEISASELLSAEDGKPPRANLLKSVSKVVKLNFPEFLFNLGGTMGAFMLGLMNFILGIILFTSMQRAMQLMIDRKPLGEEAQKLFLNLSGIATLAGVSQVACILGLGVAAEKLSSRLRLLLMKTILKQEVGWFDLEANSAGVLVITTSSIPQKITTFSGTSLGAFINVGVNIIASSAIGFYFNAKITLLMLLFLPILCGMALLSMSLMARFSKKSKLAYNEATQMACENVGQMRTVASLAKEEYIFDKYCFNQKKALKAGYKNAFITTISLSLCASVLPVIMVIAAFLSASFELDSDTFKNTTAFLGICIVMLVFTLVISDATRKMPLIPGIKQATDSAKGFYSMLQREPRINLLPNGPGKFVEADSEGFGEIAFNQVQFSYPTRLHIPSLRGISFQARRGQYIALVGPSGCGKSTSIGLIERFYDVIHGSITLDGVDIRALHLPSYRDHIALVGQEPALFNLSIKDNILMGARTYGPTPDMDDVITAAMASNIHNFIMSLPNNYNTMVGGKGTHLSGGQKQRIAIARALIRNPQILLLDEATSALDAESEKVVQAALDRASQGRTTIAIAHRLSTIKNADLILVMKDGLIVERGTHQELVDLNGLYAEMAVQQSLS